eukprot:CAMPEP_0181190720 /NCGR_PEP_ID=MMETSP1096-20121128/12344_1 /TAXON_ID=156174 ORGANISM="Chrysochromulina ericina, Strain CCMP281" /NCGR_SAMPLE_ID=MMETSP1096 /ASSEMBLY_ACC=CAM_ASM_000453 /LENGTH=171 /DNA_ID=CAMNT_0023279955 /DNA_START=664 /DNA_END=1181 /DNA_ORIENTATION=-
MYGRVSTSGFTEECAAELEGAGWQSVERSVDGDVTAIGTFILARSDNQVRSEVRQTFLERLRAECEGRVERRRVHERATALPCSRARYVLAPRQLRSPPESLMKMDGADEDSGVTDGGQPAARARWPRSSRFQPGTPHRVGRAVLRCRLEPPRPPSSATSPVGLQAGMNIM